NSDTTAIAVSSFSVAVTQQDAYFDNIIYSVPTGGNIPPTADAGADQSIQVNQSITITGSGTDSDGYITDYEWKKGTIVLATTASFSYTPDTVGTDTLTLTVTDNNGSTAIDSMNVTVTAVPSSDLQWNFFASVAEGTQFDAEAGLDNLIHLISSSYYQLNLSGDIVVNESQGDEQQAMLTFPPAIAVGDDGSVHIVTRHNGSSTEGYDIRYSRRSAAGSWDSSYLFGGRVARNYVVGISWTDTDIIMSSTDASVDGLYGDIRLWKAGDSSASYLGALTGMWRADVDIRMHGQNNKIHIGAGKHNSSSAEVYYAQADIGTGLRDRLDSNTQIHNAGNVRRSFPDLAIDGQNNTHFVYGSESEVYYNKYNANGEKIFVSDKRIFDNLGTWHLSIGLSAVAVSDNGEFVVAVSLRAKGDIYADNCDVLWAYSTDGGASWSNPQDTGKNSDAGEGRRRPRLINIGDSFILLYGDSTVPGISMGVLTFTSGESATNTLPTANAGADQNVEVNQSITITGSGTDSDGYITDYEWKKGTIVLSTTASFSYTPDTVGTDTLTLTVTDNNGSTAIDSMNVTVTAVAGTSAYSDDFSTDTTSDYTTV
ncbi:PKD domain-containing protein, partial [Sulfurovum sp. TSL6]|uniref:PKD domain-containing protein n=1 Tax=Sulfurovum sp. TSL6 TaxID=2826995 RepID=UPI001CC57365